MMYFNIIVRVCVCVLCSKYHIKKDIVFLRSIIRMEFHFRVEIVYHVLYVNQITRIMISFMCSSVLFKNHIFSKYNHIHVQVL